MTREVHDLVIVGAGPAALTAAMYTACENIETILIEKGTVGGIMAGVSRIDNYPGFLHGVSGKFLAENFRSQAEKFGARIRVGEVQKIKKASNSIVITTDSETLEARAVLVATGSSYERLWIPGEEEFYGKGIHYSGVLDGTIYTNKRLAVVGGANSAVQEALFLTKFESHIDLVVRSCVKASGILQKELSEHVDSGRITLYEGWIPDKILSDNRQITSLIVHKTDSKEQKELLIDGVFIFAGILPNTKFLISSGIKLDTAGYIITNHNMMTNISGIFAGGDVRGGITRQITSATGEGASVASFIREYLGELRSGLV